MTTVVAIRNKKDIKKIEKLLLTQNYRDFVIFSIGINSGLRISDILKLNVKDVKNKNFISIKEQKTGKLKRFPINKKLKNIFDFYTKNKLSEAPLFESRFGNRLNRIAAYNIIKSTCNKINPDYHVGTHTLRKTFGYHYYKKYKDIVMLQKILNHSTPYVTLRYIGIVQEEIDNTYINFIL